MRNLDRESITTGKTEVPVNVYRTSDPPIFAGFRQEWVNGSDPETGTIFDLSCGAGVGSKYATLIVKLPNGTTVYEYVDITELIQSRVKAIIEESM